MDSNDDHDAVIARLNEIRDEGGPAAIHQAMIDGEITVLDQPNDED